MRWYPRKKVVFAFLALALSLGSGAVLVELAYRFQLFDFYRPELLAFNPGNDLTDAAGRSTLLVLGDSFSVGDGSYVNILRKSLPRLRIINSGIPGSGIIQTSFIVRRRMREFQPSLLLYQIYVGNDLFDITYPTNWKTLSFFRNSYWFLASHWRSLSFLNYRLGQERQSLLVGGYRPYQPSDSIYEEPDIFSPSRFLNNEPLMLTADPRIIEKQVLLLEERERDFVVLVKKLRAILALKRPDCPCFLLVIPHASQVSPVNLERTTQLKGVFLHPELIQQEEYPFVIRLREAFKDCILINPLKRFQNQATLGIALYWSNDIHLNPNGNEVLAEIVAEALAVRIKGN